MRELQFHFSYVSPLWFFFSSGSKRSSIASVCTDEELAHAYANACKRAGKTPHPIANLHQLHQYHSQHNYSSAGDGGGGDTDRSTDEYRSMSDIEAGIRRFTASPPMQTVPEMGGEHLVDLSGTQTFPKQGMVERTNRKPNVQFPGFQINFK